MQIEMLFSTLMTNKLQIVIVMAVFVDFMAVYYFLSSASSKGNLFVVRKQESFMSNEVRTANDTSYVLYGDGEIDSNTVKSLHGYIRAMTLRQTPGKPRLTSRPATVHYSQIGQSQYVDKLLNGRLNGVFLECGAYDGETFSNSLFFEIRRNWTGILIEASPLQLKSLIQRNRNAFVVRSCLSGTTKPETAKFTLSGGKGGGLRSLLDKNAIRYFGGASKINVLPEIYVQCFPLTSILDALQIHHIDYLSLDVEGAEIEILKTIDWTKLTVDIFTIEYAGQSDKLRDLRALFNKTGIYREAGLLPLRMDEKHAQDVVFMHL